jgi:hypothetical protein
MRARQREVGMPFAIPRALDGAHEDVGLGGAVDGGPINQGHVRYLRARALGQFGCVPPVSRRGAIGVGRDASVSGD